MIKTFDAAVIGGHLKYQESLAALEGQRVEVTVETKEAVESQPEPPEDMDIEKDVYVKMPFRDKGTTTKVVIKEGRLQPCLILPDELPDE